VDRWDLLKDALSTGIGAGVIIWQNFSPHPSELMLGVALVLINARAYQHVKALLPARTGGESSGHPPSRSGGGSGPGGTGE